MGTQLRVSTAPLSALGPELPARRDSLPMVELNVTRQMVQETVKDLDVESSKVRCCKKYLQRCAADTEKRSTTTNKPDK